MADNGPEPEGDEDSALLIRADTAAALCSVSIRQWWRWDATGLVPRAIQIGPTKRWRREELMAWIRGGCSRREEWEEASRRP
jgi:predicted DNA-binding transcriptional regulator AlpA